MSDQKPSTASGSAKGYRVEARCYGQPKVLTKLSDRLQHPFVLDKDWREIPMSVVHEGLGVPRGPFFQANELEQTGCCGYQAAQALRWWFHANLASSFDDLCVESRLVEYSIKWSREWVKTKTHCLIGDEDRSSSMPDWGQPPSPPPQSPESK